MYHIFTGSLQDNMEYLLTILQQEVLTVRKPWYLDMEGNVLDYMQQ